MQQCVGAFLPFPCLSFFLLFPFFHVVHSTASISRSDIDTGTEQQNKQTDKQTSSGKRRSSSSSRRRPCREYKLSIQLTRFTTAAFCCFYCYSIRTAVTRPLVHSCLVVCRFSNGRPKQALFNGWPKMQMAARSWMPFINYYYII